MNDVNKNVLETLRKIARFIQQELEARTGLLIEISERGGEGGSLLLHLLSPSSEFALGEISIDYFEMPPQSRMPNRKFFVGAFTSGCFDLANGIGREVETIAEEIIRTLPENKKKVVENDIVATLDFPQDGDK